MFVYAYRPLNATNDDDKALSDLSVGEGPIGLVVPLYPPPCVVCVCTRVCVCVCVCVIQYEYLVVHVHVLQYMFIIKWIHLDNTKESLQNSHYSKPMKFNIQEKH